MKMPPFKLHVPNSVDEAIEIARDLEVKGEDFDWISGGTDLIPNYKWHLNPKKNVISLANISQLTELSETSIGAMVRLQDLIDSDFNGVLVEENDFEAYQKALETLLVNVDKRTSIQQKAVEKIQMFDEQKISTQYLNFLIN